jgi:hypothetical protein
MRRLLYYSSDELRAAVLDLLDVPQLFDSTEVVYVRLGKAAGSRSEASIRSRTGR